MPNLSGMTYSEIMPCTMLCTCTSGPTALRSSSSSTVQLQRREALLEREDLAPVAQRVLRQQPHLGQRIEHERARA